MSANVVKMSSNFKYTIIPASNFPRCFACLSTDRSLNPLKEKAALLARIFPNVAFSGRHMICWECNTVIKKLNQFKSQVLKVQDILKTTATNNNVFPGLSKLKITGVEILSISPDTRTTPNTELLDLIPAIPPLIPKPNITPLNIPDPNIPPLNIPDPNICPPSILIKLEPENSLVDIKNEMKDEDIGNFDELIQPSTIKSCNSSDEATDTASESEMYDTDPLLTVTQKEPKLNKNYIEVNCYTQEGKFMAPNIELNDRPKTLKPLVTNITPRGTKEFVKVEAGTQIMVQNNQDVKETKIYPKTIMKETKILDLEIEGTETKIYPALQVNEMERYPMQSKEAKTHSKYTKNPTAIKKVLSHKVSEKEPLDPMELGLFGFDKETIVKRVILNENDMKKYRERRKRWMKRCKIKCEKCLGIFKDQQSLDEHNLKHGLSRGEYECDICSQRFQTIIEKNEHYKHHFVVYECLKCGSQNHERMLISDHYLKTHQIGNFTCRICGKEFKTYTERSKHRASHHSPKKQSCDECGKILSCKATLESHKALHRPETIPCPICKKKVKKPNLGSHIRYSHSDGPLYWCKDCGTSYKSKSTYNMHMKTTLKHRTLDELGLKCDHCGLSFGSKSNLMDHVDAVHNDKKYTCDTCQKECLSKKRLERHIKFVHQRKKTTEGIHVCELCGKSYKDKNSLDCHMNVHLGRRPYKCQDCSDSFSYKASLYTHRRLKHKVKRRREMKIE